MPGPRNFATTPALLAVILLGGCAELPGLADIGNPFTAPTAPLPSTAAASTPTPAPAPDAVLSFVASATAGEAGLVSDAERGVALRVTAGRPYEAASGRVCRRYRVASAGAASTPTGGLACRDPAGTWRRARLLTNPDL